MVMYTRLPSDLARWGLTVRVMDGAGSRGSSSFAPGAVLAHWTGTRQRPGVPLPTLNVLVHGHGTLPGPLCQDALGRDGAYTVIAMGRANHAGKGSWRGMVGNSGTLGTEAESDGTGWTAEQRYAYPIGHAAKLWGLGRSGEYAGSHAEYATPRGRKTDINGWPGGGGGMSGFRRTVQALLDAGPDASPLNHYPTIAAAIAAQGPDPKPVTTSEEDDMTPEQDQMLRNVHKTLGTGGDVVAALGAIQAGIDGVRAVADQVSTAVVGPFASVIKGFEDKRYPLIQFIANTSARAHRTEAKVDDVLKALRGGAR